ncbi:methyl-accepting chemotaxis protein [Aquipseudomonas alcaligenes]|uniref:methyl-accepting chemotaxis protein n=1 Tax=Aquipseudomonas alcaligenes TaxID=43263 RepID=UPI0037483F3B
MTRWLANLNVSRKLTLGFALVLLLTTLITLISWISADKIIARSTKLSEIAELNLLTKELRIARLSYQADRDQESRDEALAALRKLQEQQQDLGRQLSDPYDLDLLRQQSEHAARYQRLFEQLVGTVDNRAAVHRDLTARAERIGQGLDQLMDQLTQGSGEILEEQRLPLLREISAASLQVQAARRLVLSYIGREDSQAEAAASKAVADVEAQLSQHQQSMPAGFQDELSMSVEEIKNYSASLQQFTRELNSSLDLRKQMVEIGNQLESLSGQLSSSQMNKRSQETASSRTLMIGAALFALLLGSAAAVIITRLIVQPLRATLSAAERIAAGDLSQDLRVNRADELGQLQRSMQDMTLSLRELIGHIRDSVTQIASAAEELSAVTEQTSAGVTSQKDETDQVATAMNEMTATVQEVARNAEQASHAANDADRQAKEGESAVNDAVQQMDRLAGEVQRSSAAVNQLRDESDKIGSVLDVIKAVAEQTNLLALNAAIEAARAGEAGRGFAVVADEVRGLAQRTQKSTEEIEALIGSLQQGSQQAAGLMDSSRALTEATVDLTRRAGSRLGEIADAVSAIQAMNQQIAAAAEEQTAVAEEINRSVINVRDISEQTASASEETAASSIELARLGNDLQILVSRFRT